MAQGDFTLILDEKDYTRIKRVLSELGDIEQKSVVRKGLTKGMKHITTEGKKNIRARVKSQSGNLKKSVTTAVKVNKKEQKSKGGFKRETAWYAHMVDKGTKKRWTKKGYYRGSILKHTPQFGKMFWSDAVKTKGEEALTTLTEEIINGIEKIVKS